MSEFCDFHKCNTYTTNETIKLSKLFSENNYFGISNFFLEQSNEEREHMLKLIKYVNERGGHAIVPELKKPPKVFDCLAHVFQNLLDQFLLS